LHVCRWSVLARHVVRNVAALVTRIPSDPKPSRTLTTSEVKKLLHHIEDDRYAAAGIWRYRAYGEARSLP
jgi:hypothetical protein